MIAAVASMAAFGFFMGVAFGMRLCRMLMLERMIAASRESYVAGFRSGWGRNPADWAELDVEGEP